AEVQAQVGGRGGRNREAGLSLLEQLLESGVGLLRRAEARVLAHDPRPISVHERSDAPDVWRPARWPRLAPAGSRHLGGPVDRLEWNAGPGFGHRPMLPLTRDG